MARHTGGWVKIYRALVNSDIGNNPYRFTLFCKLIGWANLQESWVEWGGQPRKCPRGCLVTSLKELSDSIECSKTTISRQLSYLRIRDSLKIEKSDRGLFIEIPNFEYYQGQDAEGCTAELPASDSRVTDGVPTVEHNEELKNKRIILPTEPNSSSVTTGEVIGEFESFSKEAKDLIAFISQKSQRGWIKLYDKNLTFIEKEAIKASEWLDINSHKTPKSNRGYARFLSGWLNRGWERHRKSLSTSTASASQTHWFKAGGSK
jgi:hypothetical protein